MFDSSRCQPLGLNNMFLKVKIIKRSFVMSLSSLHSLSELHLTTLVSAYPHIYCCIYELNIGNRHGWKALFGLGLTDVGVVP